MDFVTSNQEDYKGSTTAKAASMIWPVDSKNPNKAKINTTTVNSYNYPNWGNKEVTHEKRWHPPVRTVELPFKGKSSYSRSYSPIQPEDSAAFRSNYSESTAFQSTFSLGPKAKLDDRTTYSDKMRNYSGSGFNMRIKVKARKAEKVQASPSNYATTMNSFYQPPVQQTDPRLLKYTLQSRGLKDLMNN